MQGSGWRQARVAGMVNIAASACFSPGSLAVSILRSETSPRHSKKLLARVIGLRKHQPLTLVFSTCGGCNAGLDFDCSVLGRAAFADFA